MTTNITGNNTIDGLILLVLGGIGAVAAIGNILKSIRSFGLSKEQAKPKPDIATPSGIQTGANLLLIMGGVFIVAGVAIGFRFTDLSRFWRVVWSSAASLVGILWIWNALRIKQGSCPARWGSIPFLVIALPSLPLLGWISVPITVYCLFIKKSSRQFFQSEEKAAPSRMQLR